MLRRELRHRIATERQQFRAFAAIRAGRIALVCVAVILVVVVVAANTRLFVAAIGSPFFYAHLAAVYVLDRKRMLWYTSRVAGITAVLLATVGVRYAINPPTTATAPLVLLLGVTIMALLGALVAFVIYLLRFGYGERPVSPREWWRWKLRVPEIRQIKHALRYPSGYRQHTVLQVIEDTHRKSVQNPTEETDTVLDRLYHYWEWHYVTSFITLYRLWRQGDVTVTRSGLRATKTLG